MGIWEKIKDIIFVSDDEEYEDEVAEENETSSREKVEEPSYTSKKEPPARIIKSKTANYSNPNNSMQVVLVKPSRFDEVTTIADQLNEGKTVVLNLEETPKEIQRRIVDFLSGVAYANGGNMRKVAKNTFIIVARGVDVMGELLPDDFEDGRIYF